MTRDSEGRRRKKMRGLSAVEKEKGCKLGLSKNDLMGKKSGKKGRGQGGNGCRRVGRKKSTSRTFLNCERKGEEG